MNITPQPAQGINGYSKIYLLQGCEQSSDSACPEVEGRESEAIDQHQHNVLPAKGRRVLPDRLHL